MAQARAERMEAEVSILNQKLAATQAERADGLAHLAGANQRAEDLAGEVATLQAQATTASG